MSYRLVIHGIPDRAAARTLAADMFPGSVWEPNITMTIEADDVETATTDRGGPVIEPVSLRKDTPAPVAAQRDGGGS